MAETRKFRWSAAAMAGVAMPASSWSPRSAVCSTHPHLHTPELAQLSAWARASTPRDAVFLFADAGKQLQPGIFRTEALRAVYVDWKGGGQVNYLADLGEQWWSRWQQAMAAPFDPPNVARYGALGIDYIVLSPRNRLPAAPRCLKTPGIWSIPLDAVCGSKGCAPVSGAPGAGKSGRSLCR
jgi:hypothetical protein